MSNDTRKFIEKVDSVHSLIQQLVESSTEAMLLSGNLRSQNHIESTRNVLVGYMLIGQDGKPVKPKVYADEVQAEKAKAGMIRMQPFQSHSYYVLPVFRPAVSTDPNPQQSTQPTTAPSQSEGTPPEQVQHMIALADKMRAERLGKK